MKIINIGIFPPPFGGVSVHLKRLQGVLIRTKIDALLIDISGIDSHQEHVINKSVFKMFLYLLLNEKKSVVHFHIFSLKLIFLFYLLSFKHICILSFHNERFLDQLKLVKGLFFPLFKYLLNNLDMIIVDNNKCLAMAQQIMFKSEKLRLIPEFIPPADIPRLELDDINNLRKNHKFLLSSNAYKISFHNNTDLYGIDLLIELCNILVNEHKLDAVIVFLLPNLNDKVYFNRMLAQIEHYNLSKRFIFITKPIKDANSLWDLSDLVIRATNTDGNSVSVLEAQSLGIPVLASDCVERPQNTILFKTRELHDLVKKTAEILSNMDSFKLKMNNAKPKDNSAEFVELYKKLAC